MSFPDGGRNKKAKGSALDMGQLSSKRRLRTGAEGLAPTVTEFFDQILNFKLRPKATENFIHATPFENLSITPADGALEELQAKLESRYKIYKLKEALEKLDFDEIWMDTPPALHFYTRSALIAADACLIQFDCDEFSRLFDTLEKGRKSTRRKKRI